MKYRYAQQGINILKFETRLANKVENEEEPLNSF